MPLSHAENFEFRRQAYRAYRRARAWGRIPEPAGCEECGKPGQLVGHHDDYCAPLRVRWLCRVCHAKAHWGTLKH